MDLRGYGASDKTPHGYDTITSAADVANVIRSLGEPDATVIGHDWGGWIAWSMPGLEPRVTRAVGSLGDAAPGADARGRRPVTGPAPRAALAGAPAGAVLARALPDRPGVRREAPAAPGPARAGRAPRRSSGTPPRCGIPFVAHSAAEYYRWLVRSQPRRDGRRFRAGHRAGDRGAGAPGARLARRRLRSRLTAARRVGGRRRREPGLRGVPVRAAPRRRPLPARGAPRPGQRPPRRLAPHPPLTPVPDYWHGASPCRRALARCVPVPDLGSWHRGRTPRARPQGGPASGHESRPRSGLGSGHGLRQGAGVDRLVQFGLGFGLTARVPAAQLGRRDDHGHGQEDRRGQEGPVGSDHERVLGQLGRPKPRAERRAGPPGCRRRRPSPGRPARASHRPAASR